MGQFWSTWEHFGIPFFEDKSTIEKLQKRCEISLNMPSI